MTKDFKFPEEVVREHYERWLKDYNEEKEKHVCEDYWVCPKCGKPIKRKFCIEDIKA